MWCHDRIRRLVEISSSGFPGDENRWDVAGGKVGFGKFLREFDGVGGLGNVFIEPVGEQGETVGRNLIEVAPVQFLQDAVAQGAGLLQPCPPGVVQGFSEHFIFHGTFVGEPLSMGAAPTEEGGPFNADFGGDGGVGGTPGAEGDEAFDELGIFSVHNKLF
jgi:hypothetical protein